MNPTRIILSALLILQSAVPALADSKDRCRGLNAESIDALTRCLFPNSDEAEVIANIFKDNSISTGLLHEALLPVIGNTAAEEVLRKKWRENAAVEMRRKRLQPDTHNKAFMSIYCSYDEDSKSAAPGATNQKDAKGQAIAAKETSGKSMDSIPQKKGIDIEVLPAIDQCVEFKKNGLAAQSQSQGSLTVKDPPPSKTATADGKDKKDKEENKAFGASLGMPLFGGTIGFILGFLIGGPLVGLGGAVLGGAAGYFFGSSSSGVEKGPPPPAAPTSP